MATSTFSYEDYDQMQARLDPALDKLRTEIPEALEQHKDSSHLWYRLKAGWELTEEWLGSRDRWPAIMDGETLNSLDRRKGEWFPPSPKVLYVTKEEFQALSQRDLDYFPYIVIKGGYKEKLGHHLETLQKKFEAHPKARVDIQSYTSTFIGGLASPVYDGGVAKQSARRLDDMLTGLKHANSKPLMREHNYGEPWKKSLPWNWLNLNVNIFDDIDAPTDAHECLRYLNDTIANLQPWQVSPSTTRTFCKPSDHGDVQACLKSNILGEKG